jgi:hypothetical protein
MRIISKFHDYYDSAMGFGQDPALVYRREISVLDWSPIEVHSEIARIFAEFRWWHSFPPRLTVIGFCGKAYASWFTDVTVLTPESLQSHRKTRDWMESAEVRAAREAAFGRSFYGQEVPRAAALGEIIRGVPLDDEIFRKADAPVFIAYLLPSEGNGRPSKTRIVRNPRLANLGFHRYHDAFSAFQEIAMYLGSNLAALDDAPRTVGDDRIIAASKGFDEQSFRTLAPGLKKLNRKLNRARKR